jgi:hypothetical protein
LLRDQSANRLVELQPLDLGRRQTRNFERGVADDEAVLFIALGKTDGIHSDLEFFEGAAQGGSAFGLEHIEGRQKNTVLLQGLSVARRKDFAPLQKVPFDQAIGAPQFESSSPGGIGEESPARDRGAIADLNPQLEPQGLSPIGR